MLVQNKAESDLYLSFRTTLETSTANHIEVQADKCGLAKDSIVLLEQIRTIDKKRLKDKMGELDLNSMNRVNTALSISFGLEL